MRARKTEIVKALAIFFVALPVMLSSLAFAAPKGKTTAGGTILAKVEEIFTARFVFYKDNNPDPNDPDLGTELQGENPALEFDIKWDGSFDLVPMGDSGKRVLMARNLGADSIIRVLIGVINNTSGSYTITSEATPLASGANTLPNGSYTVVAIGDPGPPGARNPNAGIGTFQAGTTAVGVKTLYQSDGKGTPNVIHAVYSISSGYQAENKTFAGVDVSKGLIDVGVKSGDYSGSLTLTVAKN